MVAVPRRQGAAAARRAHGDGERRPGEVRRGCQNDERGVANLGLTQIAAEWDGGGRRRGEGGGAIRLAVAEVFL